VQKAEKAAKASSPSGNPLLKRKRSDVDNSDPKLKEFLEAMRPKSNSNIWGTEDTQAQDVNEPPRKVQAMELPEAESDNEYEIVPKKSIREQFAPVPTAATVAVVPTAESEPLETQKAEIQGEPPQGGGGLDATDNDWLRSRTNRLLDLVDPADLAVKTLPEEDRQRPPLSEERLPSADVDTAVKHELIAKKVAEEVPSDSPDLTVEAIQTSGRLFVRNLPYSATEDDLRKHFESYGTLEEVSVCY
jgi:multiple RNA-binding domain-containing protein 1